MGTEKYTEIGKKKETILEIGKKKKKRCYSFTHVVSLLFYLNIYHALLLRNEHCTTEKSKHRLPGIEKYI